MEADVSTYEKALNSLARENRRLHLKIAGLNRRIEALMQEQIEQLEDRSRMVEGLRDNRNN